MTVLVYDNTWSGFLSAVFEAYERKLKQGRICSQRNQQASLLDTSINVFTDDVKAKRVWMGLEKKLSKTGLQNVHHSFLSELPAIEDHLLKYIRLVLTLDGAEKAYGNTSILRVTQVAKMVYREKHRMEAFVRFQLTKDGIYYAAIDPDFNVLPILVTHFEKRYADQKWLIYDLRRKYGIFYDLEKVQEIELDFAKPEDKDIRSIFSEDEEVYQTLWKDYFVHVNIKERRNIKLHLRHVPKRYWKYLIEKSL